MTIRSCGEHLYRETVGVGGPPVSSQGSTGKKQSKEARSPFKIENTEPLMTRNPVNPGILQQKITLNGNKLLACQSTRLRRVGRASSAWEEGVRHPSRLRASGRRPLHRRNHKNGKAFFRG
jgi:hypothetical protein